MKAFVAAAVLASAGVAGAQAPSPVPSPPPAAAPEAVDPDPDSADISLTATVRYRELKFEQVGNPQVEFKGGVDAPALGAKAGLVTLWRTERDGLPRPVQPGVIYRDGAVRLTITSRFEDLVRLFASPPAAPPAAAPVPSPSPGSDPTAHRDPQQ